MNTNINMNKSFVCVLVLMILGSAAWAVPKGQPFTKMIKESFPITPDGVVDIDHRFGRLDIYTGKNSEVRFEIEVVVYARSESIADKTFERVHIAFSNSSNKVTAKTNIGSNNNWSWKNGNDSEFEVNYKVWVPKSSYLDVELSHGKGEIVAMDNEGEVSLRHADMKLERFAKTLKLDLAHSELTGGDFEEVHAQVRHSDISVDRIERLQMRSQHSDVNLDAADRIWLNSQHSDLEIGDVNVLVIESRHDDLEIDEVVSLELNGRYTDTEVGKLSENIKTVFHFADLEIHEVNEGFKSILIEGEHANFDLGLKDASNYKLEVAGNHCGVDYPRNLKLVSHKDENSYLEIVGIHGSESNAKVFKARLTHANLDIE